MRFITHEAVSAISQYANLFNARGGSSRFDEAIATLPPAEQKAIVRHYITQSCGNACNHGDSLREGLKSLSHYYPTPALDKPDLR